MKFTDITFNDPLKITIYGERYLNDRKGRFEDYSEVDTRYDPQGEELYVNLPYTLLSHEHCLELQSVASQELLDWVHVGNRRRFFWHPNVTRDFKVNGFVRAQPSSSTRTLLTEQDPRVYIKTDLDKKHFRFVRKLQKSSVEHSVRISGDLRDFCATPVRPSRYAFLPESLGLVVKGGCHDGSGVIFRETTPYPRVEDRRVILPYHTLYALDPSCPEDEPLLIQAIRFHASRGALNFFVSEVVGPILESWVSLVSRRGLLPELHGQNALVEIDERLRFRRMVHRDFQGIYSDSQIRSNLGLPLLCKHAAGTEEGTAVQSQYSNVFDSLIGRYLLSRLSKVFCLYFNMEYRSVASAIRSYHNSLAGWEEAKFPSTVHRFGTSARQQVGNDVLLVDTGEKPEFR